MHTDPIADMLTRIRNGQRACHETVAMPASKSKIAIAHILKQEGFISSYKCIRDNRQGILRIVLKYRNALQGVIREIKRISKPGCRRYVACKDIPLFKNGFGVVILSTSMGIMSGSMSRSKGIGGELLCSVY